MFLLFEKISKLLKSFPQHYSKICFLLIFYGLCKNENAFCADVILAKNLAAKVQAESIAQLILDEGQLSSLIDETEKELLPSIVSKAKNKDQDNYKYELCLKTLLNPIVSNVMTNGRDQMVEALKVFREKLQAYSSKDSTINTSEKNPATAFLEFIEKKQAEFEEYSNKNPDPNDKLDPIYEYKKEVQALRHKDGKVFSFFKMIFNWITGNKSELPKTKLILEQSYAIKTLADANNASNTIIQVKRRSQSLDINANKTPTEDPRRTKSMSDLNSDLKKKTINEWRIKVTNPSGRLTEDDQKTTTLHARKIAELVGNVIFEDQEFLNFTMLDDQQAEIPPDPEKFVRILLKPIVENFVLNDTTKAAETTRQSAMIEALTQYETMLGNNENPKLLQAIQKQRLALQDDPSNTKDLLTIIKSNETLPASTDFFTWLFEKEQNATDVAKDSPETPLNHSKLTALKNFASGGNLTKRQLFDKGLITDEAGSLFPNSVLEKIQAAHNRTFNELDNEDTTSIHPDDDAVSETSSSSKKSNPTLTRKESLLNLDAAMHEEKQINDPTENILKKALAFVEQLDRQGAEIQDLDSLTKFRSEYQQAFTELAKSLGIPADDKNIETILKKLKEKVASPDTADKKALNYAMIYLANRVFLAANIAFVSKPTAAAIASAKTKRADMLSLHARLIPDDPGLQADNLRKRVELLITDESTVDEISKIADEVKTICFESATEAKAMLIGALSAKNKFTELGLENFDPEFFDGVTERYSLYATAETTDPSPKGQFEAIIKQKVDDPSLDDFLQKTTDDVVLKTLEPPPTISKSKSKSKNPVSTPQEKFKKATVDWKQTDEHFRLAMFMSQAISMGYSFDESFLNGQIFKSENKEKIINLNKKIRESNDTNDEETEKLNAELAILEPRNSWSAEQFAVQRLRDENDQLFKLIDSGCNDHVESVVERNRLITPDQLTTLEELIAKANKTASNGENIINSEEAKAFQNQIKKQFEEMIKGEKLGGTLLMLVQSNEKARSAHPDQFDSTNSATLKKWKLMQDTSKEPADLYQAARDAVANVKKLVFNEVRSKNGISGEDNDPQGKLLSDALERLIPLDFDPANQTLREQASDMAAVKALVEINGPNRKNPVLLEDDDTIKKILIDFENNTLSPELVDITSKLNGYYLTNNNDEQDLDEASDPNQENQLLSKLKSASNDERKTILKELFDSTSQEEKTQLLTDYHTNLKNRGLLPNAILVTIDGETKWIDWKQTAKELKASPQPAQLFASHKPAQLLTIDMLQLHLEKKAFENRDNPDKTINTQQNHLALASIKKTLTSNNFDKPAAIEETLKQLLHSNKISRLAHIMADFALTDGESSQSPGTSNFKKLKASFEAKLKAKWDAQPDNSGEKNNEEQSDDQNTKTNKIDEFDNKFKTIIEGYDASVNNGSEKPAQRLNRLSIKLIPELNDESFKDTKLFLTAEKSPSTKQLLSNFIKSKPGESSTQQNVTDKSTGKPSTGNGTPRLTKTQEKLHNNNDNTTQIESITENVDETSNPKTITESLTRSSSVSSRSPTPGSDPLNRSRTISKINLEQLPNSNSNEDSARSSLSNSRPGSATPITSPPGSARSSLSNSRPGSATPITSPPGSATSITSPPGSPSGSPTGSTSFNSQRNSATPKAQSPSSRRESTASQQVLGGGKQ